MEEARVCGIRWDYSRFLRRDWGVVVVVVVLVPGKERWGW